MSGLSQLLDPYREEPPTPEGPSTVEIVPPKALSDRVFRGVARTSGIVVLLIMTSVGLFLGFRAWQAISARGVVPFLTTAQWDPDSGNFGIKGVLVGSVLIALVAIVIALPLALGMALYISEYAPRQVKQTLIAAVDLMAAVPSVVFGLWGFFLLNTQVLGLARWISTYFGWVPFLSVEGADPSDPLSTETVYKSSTFIVGIVVALMVTPIATSVMREVFSQAPQGEREAALALGSTRWGMIRAVVLPFGKGGIIGGTMLGLGRALGETIAVFMIISFFLDGMQWRVLESGGSSVSSLIALRYGEASEFGTSALMAAGLALFVMTLVVNFVASSIVARSRSGQSSEA